MITCLELPWSMSMYRKKIYVRCKKCDEWIDEDKTKFVNIEEDFQGRDILTFKCHQCETVQKSIRLG